MGNPYTEKFGLEGTAAVAGSAFGPAWSASVREAPGALLAAPLCPSRAGQGRLGVHRRSQALCLPGEMVGAADGSAKAAPEPALSPACRSAAGGRFLPKVWVMRLSLSPSGKSTCTKERAPGTVPCMPKGFRASKLVPLGALLTSCGRFLRHEIALPS